MRLAKINQENAWLWLLAVALLYGAFFVLRYGGLWIENDTGVFSNAAVEFIRHGTIFYPQPYPHGFAYTAVLGGLSLLTGLGANTLNTVVMPFVGITLLVVPGYLAFSQMVASRAVAVLSALLLLAIPNITFSALRGTHEKLSMAFVCMGLFCLFKALDAMAVGSRVHRLLWVALFLLVNFLNAASNDYFASTFTFALTLTLGLGWMLQKFRRVDPAADVRGMLRAMTLLTAASWAIVLATMFWVYPPARQDFLLVNGVMSKLTHLFATLQPSSNPYSSAAAQWANGTTYQLLNLFRWFVVVCSASMWAVHSYHVVFKRRLLTRGQLFLLSMYSAFALLVVASVPVDFSGLAAGANLEVRNFTYVTLVGAPLAAQLVYILTIKPWTLPVLSVKRWGPLVARTFVVVLMSIMLVLGFLKVTLDPLVSNHWLFYTASEKQAMQFFWTHNQQQTLWTGPDDRLAFYAHAQLVESDPRQNTIIGYAITPFTKEYLRSAVVVGSSQALHFTMPVYRTEDRIYDNGGAQIYFHRPVSRFMP